MVLTRKNFGKISKFIDIVIQKKVFVLCDTINDRILYFKKYNTEPVDHWPASDSEISDAIKLNGLTWLNIDYVQHNENEKQDMLKMKNIYTILVLKVLKLWCHAYFKNSVIYEQLLAPTQNRAHCCVVFEYNDEIIAKIKKISKQKLKKLVQKELINRGFVIKKNK